MISIDKLTFSTGNLNQSYDVPVNTASIAFQAVSGDIDMRLDSGSGGDEWTIKMDEKEEIRTRTVSKQTLWFTGADGTSLQIRRLTGVLS